MHKNVIILDGHLRSALVAARSLGAHGYRVVCGSPRRTGLALYSRYTRDTFRYPSPLDSLAGFREAVIAVARRCDRPPMVFAFSDSTLAALSRSRELFGDAVVLVLPSVESVEIALDKRRTVTMAKELGITVPPTYDEIPDTLNFPAVIKPRRNVVWRGDRGVTARVAIVRSRDELTAMWRDILIRTGEAPFVQQYIPASEYGYSVVCDHGRVRARCVHRRIRSLSPSGGASAVRVTVSPPPGMAHAAEALVRRLDWHGPAMIEFRVGHDGIPYLVEINGRFWGSLALAVHAGVDMPFLAAQVARDGCADVPDFRRDVYSRYLVGDLAHLLRARSGRALKEFLAYRGPGHFYDVESWADPLPAVMDVIDKLF